MWSIERVKEVGVIRKKEISFNIRVMNGGDGGRGVLRREGSEGEGRVCGLGFGKDFDFI